MKEIPLSRGLSTLVDEDVYEWASKFKWHAVAGRGHKLYAARRDRAGRRRFLHKEICNSAPGQVVDHRDGNGLHNWRTNLRPASFSQNAANRPPASGRAYKGVRWNRSKRRFEANIRVKGKRRWLGLFKTPQAAAAAYDAAAVKQWGEFAWVNGSRMQPTRQKRLRVEDKPRLRLPKTAPQRSYGRRASAAAPVHPRLGGITFARLATALGISSVQIRRLAAAGEFGELVPNCVNRVSLEGLQTFLDRRRVDIDG